MLARTRYESRWPVGRFGGEPVNARARRAWARLVAARDAFELASGPEAVDRALERLQAAERAYWAALRGEEGPDA